MECAEILSRSGLPRKRGRDLVKRVAGEAPPAESSQDCRRDVLPREQAPHAKELGLESRDRVGGFLGRQQAPPQVGADRTVTVATTRERLGAGLRQPCVVDEPRTIEGRDCLFRCSAAVPRAREPLLEVASRSPARGERSGRLSQRSRTANFACKLPRGVPIEPASDR